MNKSWLLSLTACMMILLLLPSLAMTEEKDPFGAYDEPISITSVMAYSPPTDLELPKDVSPENFSFLHEAKRRFNIDYSFKWTAPADQFSQKFGVALVSGDLPDAMVVSASDYKLMLEEGLL